MTTAKKSQSIAIAILAIVAAAALFFAASVAAVGVPSAGAASKGTTACFNTAKGTVFLRTTCKPGERKVVLGVPGATGAAGAAGPSAFDLAKIGGFSGTIADWLNTLVGLSGLSGSQGALGAAGQNGSTGLTGTQGAVGPRGATGPTGAQGAAGLAGFIPAYGSFYDTTTQTNRVVNQVNVFTFNSSPIKTSGVTVEGESKITFAKSGTYNIQFSAQLFAETGDLSKQIDIWLSKNGANVEFSNTQVQVHPLDNRTGKAVAAWNFVVRAEQDGDFFELLWLSDQASMIIAAVPAEETLARVAVPSVILTVTQVG